MVDYVLYQTFIILLEMTRDRIRMRDESDSQELMVSTGLSARMKLVHMMPSKEKEFRYAKEGTG